MKKLSIEVINKKPTITNKELSYKGQIIIGDFKENFLMPSDSWTIDEYKQQWKEGLARIKTHDVSCLISAVRTLKNRPRMDLWILYKVGTTIFIQNHLLGGKIFKERAVGLPSFDSKTCYLYIPPREIFSDDGGKISEWSVDLQDI